MLLIDMLRILSYLGITAIIIAGAIFFLLFPFENQRYDSCPLPLSWLDKQQIIIRNIVIKDAPPKIKTKKTEKPVYINKQTIQSDLISKKKIGKTPAQSCETEEEACRADKHCKAKGCTELKYYYEGLTKVSERNVSER